MTVAQLHRPAARPLPAAVPDALADVALIDAKTCAAAAGMSISWWNERVAAGEAPRPAIREPRCTRWRLADVRAYLQRRAEGGREGAGQRAACEVMAKARRASAAARAKTQPAG